VDLHRHASLEDPPARIVQDKARDQTQHEVPIIGIFTVDLAGVGGQQMLEGTKDLFNQVAARPDPKQAGGGDL